MDLPRLAGAALDGSGGAGWLAYRAVRYELRSISAHLGGRFGGPRVGNKQISLYNQCDNH